MKRTRLGELAPGSVFLCPWNDGTAEVVRVSALGVTIRRKGKTRTVDATIEDDDGQKRTRRRTFTSSETLTWSRETIVMIRERELPAKQSDAC